MSKFYDWPHSTEDHHGIKWPEFKMQSISCLSLQVFVDVSMDVVQNSETQYFSELILVTLILSQITIYHHKILISSHSLNPSYLLCELWYKINVFPDWYSQPYRFVFVISFSYRFLLFCQLSPVFEINILIETDLWSWHYK